MHFCLIKKDFLQYLAQTSTSPPLYQFVDSEGIYLIDESGKKYIDLISGIAVNNIGHKNQNVIEAVKDQVDRFSHQMVYGEYVISPQVELAKKLARLLPSQLNCSYFLNSGSEAIEASIKLARKHSGRHKLVAMRGAYHGSSTGALSLMSDETYSGPYKPLLPEVYFVDYNSEDLSIIDDTTAAVFVEVIQAETGYTRASQQFLTALQSKCREAGSLLVVDEIQTGIGRTGSLYAFEQTSMQPDILLSAKALGGGMPISAMITSKEIMASLTQNPILGHITTFGGHPVSCAAAIATLNFLEREKLIETIAQKEALFRERLVHPKIQKVTGLGLLLAVHLDSFDEVEKAMKKCFKNGLIVDWFLYNMNALRIAPPLIITLDEIDHICTILLAALDD